MPAAASLIIKDLVFGGFRCGLFACSGHPVFVIAIVAILAVSAVAIAVTYIKAIYNKPHNN